MKQDIGSESSANYLHTCFCTLHMLDVWMVCLGSMPFLASAHVTAKTFAVKFIERQAKAVIISENTTTVLNLQKLSF